MSNEIDDSVKKNFLDALRDATAAIAMKPNSQTQDTQAQQNIAMNFLVWMAECGWSITKDREPTDTGKIVLDAVKDAETHVANCEECKAATREMETTGTISRIPHTDNQPAQREPEYVGAGYL